MEAEIRAHLGEADLGGLKPGDAVIGTLPIPIVARLTAQGVRYRHLALDLGPADRGRQLSADDMDRLGARLEDYVATAMK